MKTLKELGIKPTVELLQMFGGTYYQHARDNASELTQEQAASQQIAYEFSDDAADTYWYYRFEEIIQRYGGEIVWGKDQQ